MAKPFTPAQVRRARWIAVAADLVQITLIPLWAAPPAAATLNVAIDVVVCVILCVMLRPHWAFAPAFVAEAIPMVDVIPLWTASVLFVTRGQRTADDPALPPPPPPLPPPPKPAA